jgi:hypothetical protein
MNGGHIDESLGSLLVMGKEIKGMQYIVAIN